MQNRNDTTSKKGDERITMGRVKDLWIEEQRRICEDHSYAVENNLVTTDTPCPCEECQARRKEKTL